MQHSTNENFSIYSGYLIVFEGIDGSGKTIQAELLSKKLKKKGYDVVQGREPTYRKYGKLLRESMKTGRFEAKKELELFLLDRQDHVENFIVPSLEKGKVVILDRYYFSNMVYQGLRGFDVEEIRKSNEKFAPKPNILFLLDLDEQEAIQRLIKRDGVDGLNDFEKREDLMKAREMFLNLIEIDKYNKVVIDANKNQDIIKKQIIKTCNKRLEPSNYSANIEV